MIRNGVAGGATVYTDEHRGYNNLTGYVNEPRLYGVQFRANL